MIPPIDHAVGFRPAIPDLMILNGVKPVADAARRSAATLHATDGKLRRRVESGPGQGPGRRCAHLPETQFPAASTRAAGATGFTP